MQQDCPCFKLEAPPWWPSRRVSSRISAFFFVWNLQAALLCWTLCSVWWNLHDYCCYFGCHCWWCSLLLLQLRYHVLVAWEESRHWNYCLVGLCKTICLIGVPTHSSWRVLQLEQTPPLLEVRHQGRLLKFNSVCSSHLWGSKGWM